MGFGEQEGGGREGGGCDVQCLFFLIISHLLCLIGSNVSQFFLFVTNSFYFLVSFMLTVCVTMLYMCESFAALHTATQNSSVADPLTTKGAAH